MSKQAALDFLARHGMSPELVQPARDAEAMRREMERGLARHEGSLAMIPTYLSDDGVLPLDKPVAVIDAGGTNFRRALVSFTAEGCQVEELQKWKMPGIEQPATWEEFISFTADCILPLMDRTDRIGFCFSYSADITPDMDGCVEQIDKEVVISGSAGQMVGASLNAELARRGVPGKKIVILNDTVAVLLGGLATVDRSEYSGFIGQVSGTGTNTCCSLPLRRIGKLGIESDRSIVINLESGMYDGMPAGDFDRVLDENSHNPGQKAFEKHTAGVYLGELVHTMLLSAAEEGLLSPAGAEKVRALGKIDSAVIDAWACGENLGRIAGTDEDAEFVQALCVAMFERSARCMCVNQAAILLLTGVGAAGKKPACICAEGSLVQKGRVYRQALQQLIDEEINGKLGLNAVLRISNEATLPGSAAAALLNT